jgi:hypothetical protein
LEAEGKISNVKAQMTKSKWRDLWESGKTSSERELNVSEFLRRIGIHRLFATMDFCYPSWNDGMLDYWNSAYQMWKEQIKWFLAGNPLFQYSIIPIFQAEWSER